jgi:hypothetical protein
MDQTLAAEVEKAEMDVIAATEIQLRQRDPKACCANVARSRRSRRVFQLSVAWQGSTRCYSPRTEATVGMSTTGKRAPSRFKAPQDYQTYRSVVL